MSFLFAWRHQEAFTSKYLTYRIETFHGPVGSCGLICVVPNIFFFWLHIQFYLEIHQIRDEKWRKRDREIIRHIKLQMEITHYSGQMACIDWQSAMWSAETCIPSVCDPNFSHLHLRHQLALKLFQGLWMPSWLWVVQLCPVLRLQRFRWAEFSQYTRSNTEILQLLAADVVWIHQTVTLWHWWLLLWAFEMFFHYLRFLYSATQDSRQAKANDVILSNKQKYI